MPDRTVLSRPWSVIVLIVCLLNFVSPSWEKNVLGLFPHFGYSHFKVFYPILYELAKRGHNVTVVSYLRNPKPLPNYHDIVLEGEGGVSVLGLEHFVPTRSLNVMFSEFWALHNEGQSACERFYESGAVEEVSRIHSDTPFDVVLLENFNTDCHLAVPYMFQIPIVGLSSCALMPWHYDRVGLPDTPSFIPSEFVGFTDSMSWSERMVNFIVTKGVKMLYRYTELADNKVIRNHLKMDVDVREIAKSTSLILVNQHYTLSGNRPLTQQVIEIGGVHIPPETEQDPIPVEVERFLNKSANGVIFISWGSMLRGSSIPKYNVAAMVEGLKALDFNVVWKWEDDQLLPTDDERFLFVKWAPQRSLLCHPNVRLFWSHGGLLGTSEAVHCGKPLLVTPIYGDQFLNAKAVENRKMAKILLFDDITTTDVQKSLKEVLKKSFATNARHVSQMYRTRPNSPLNTSIWWIEHVMNSKGNHLMHTEAVELNWFVYNSLDSVSVLVIVCLGIVLGLRVTLTRCKKHEKIKIQ